MRTSGTSTATILVSDIADIAGIIGEHGGSIVRTGGQDVIAAFEAASDAIAAAAVMQSQAASTTPGTHARVGIASGDVGWDDGDCFGPPVVIASRLFEAARPGEILVSGVTRTLAADRAVLDFVERAELTLDGVPAFAGAFEVVWASDDKASNGPWVVPAGLSVTSDRPFVGRDSQWNSLARCWKAVRRGQRRLVTIGGEAGAGKTRLAAEFAHACVGEGARALYGYCDRDLAAPYQPWAMLIDQIANGLPEALLAEEVADDLPTLATVVPRLERLRPGLRRPPPADAETEKFRLVTAIAAAIERFGAAGPAVVVLDDLHWAGAPTLAVLRHLGRSRAGRGLLIVATFRDTGDEITEPLASCLADLRRLDDCEGLHLGGLDLAEIELLVGSRGKLDPIRRDMARRIAERTGGNPFYVTELWRHVSTSEMLRTSTDPTVPPSVREVVAARLAGLSPTARTIADLTALAGARVELAVLIAAMQLATRDVAAGLDEVVTAGLLMPQEGPRPHYQYVHTLLGEAVAESLSPIAKAQVHLTLAEAIETVHEADRRAVLADLARHFTAATAVDAGANGKAIYYSRRAATQALRTAAYDECLQHLETAIELAGDPSPELVEMLLQRGEVLSRIGSYDHSLGAYRQAFVTAADCDDTALACRAAIGFERSLHLSGGSGERALDVIAAAQRLVHASDRALRASLRAAEGRALLHAGRHDEAIATILAAEAEARSLEDADVLAVALESRVMGETSNSSSTVAGTTLISIGAELEQIRMSAGDEWGAMWGTSNSIRGMLMVGQLREARTTLERHRERAERGRFVIYTIMVHAFDAMLHSAAGRFDLAEASIEAAQRANIDGSHGPGVYGVQMFLLRRDQGRLHDVAGILRVVASMPDTGMVWAPGLALLYAELGMHDPAQTAFDTIVADGLDSVPHDAMWPGVLAFVAETCAELAARDHAQMLYELLTPMAGGNIALAFTSCLGPADRLRGALAALAGRADDAEAHFRAALDLARRSDSPSWRARTLSDWARAMALSGDPRTAATATEARSLATSIGMLGIANRRHPAVDDPVAAAATAGVRPAGLAGRHGMTSREIEVLRLVAAGCSNRQIGERLFISQNTAANHVRSILQKTGCANRAEAAAFAVRLDSGVGR